MSPHQDRVESDLGEVKSSFSRKALYGCELEFSLPSFLHFCNTSKGKGSLHTPAAGFQLQLRVFNSCLRRKMNIVPKNRKRFAGLKDNALKW